GVAGGICSLSRVVRPRDNERLWSRSQELWLCSPARRACLEGWSVRAFRLPLRGFDARTLVAPRGRGEFGISRSPHRRTSPHQRHRSKAVRSALCRIQTTREIAE